MVLSKNSWHHRLAYFYGHLSNWDTSPTICEYISAMMRGLFVVLFSLMLGGLVVVAPLADFFTWIYVGLTINFVNPRYGTMVIISYFGAGLVVGSLFGLFTFMEYMQGKPKAVLYKRYTTTIFYRVFHAWSNKYCFTISFK